MAKKMTVDGNTAKSLSILILKMKMNAINFIKKLQVAMR